MHVSRQRLAFLALGFVLAIGILLWTAGLLPSFLWLVPIALAMALIYPVRRASRGE